MLDQDLSFLEYNKKRKASEHLQAVFFVFTLAVIIGAGGAHSSKESFFICLYIIFATLFGFALIYTYEFIFKKTGLKRLVHDSTDKALTLTSRFRMSRIQNRILNSKQICLAVLIGTFIFLLGVYTPENDKIIWDILFWIPASILTVGMLFALAGG